MAYTLDHREVFRLADVTDANGRRTITYEQRELWVQVSPPDSYWVVPATCTWQLTGGGNTLTPAAILRPVNDLLPRSGAYTLNNPVTLVATALGTQTSQFPQATVPASGSFVETVTALGPPGGVDQGALALREMPLTRQRLYTFMGADDNAAPTPPVVTLVSPAEGAIDADVPIVIEVTDADGFAGLLIVAEMPAVEIADVVHDGTEFKPAYAARSSREAITDGYRYTILRRAAWPSAPTITAHPIDTLGAASE